MNTYTVPRIQGTYADSLTALGLAKLLSALTNNAPVTLCLDNQKDAFIIESDTPDLTIKVGQIYEYIKTEKDKDAPADAYDYKHWKEERQNFFSWRKQHPKTDIKEYGKDPPSSNFSLYSSLVDMLKPINSSSYASAYRELASERGITHFKIALEAFSSAGLYIEVAEIALKKQLKDNKANEVSIVQIFNPMTGKGMNSPKANSIGMGQEKAPLVLEALKYAGWFVGAVTVTPKGSKDLKVLVVQTAQFDIDSIERVMQDFRRSFTGGGAIQVDILAALTLTETLLQYHEAQEADWMNPAKVITGFQTAYFQNLGSAKGVTNISFIALPHWVNLNDDAGRGEWLDILKEHHQIIRSLDESHSEERNLLEKYRDFLSGQDVRAFLEFLSDYGPYTMRIYERLHGKPEFRRKVRWLSEAHLSQVFKAMEKGESMDKQEKKLTEIIETPGFMNIAKAIRGATRNAVMAKKPMQQEGKPPRQPDRSYEIRYGLAQDLKRAAVTKQKFLAALSSFIADYNAENLRVYERRANQIEQQGKLSGEPQRRVDISTDDLMEMAALLDKHDSQTVAMLLIAYGYSKTERKQKEEVNKDETSQNPDQNTNNQEENE